MPSKILVHKKNTIGLNVFLWISCMYSLKLGSHLLKNFCVICFIESPVKVMKMIFISSQKLFSFSRYLSFYHEVLAMQKKRLDWKDKVNFKVHDVTTLLTNNFDTRNAQYLTKQKQLNKETQSINRIQQEKYFFSKIMQKMRQGDQFQTSFHF